MSTLTFPTCPGWAGKGHTTRPGTPKRAQHCRCDHPLVLVDRYTNTCVRCGHYERTTIDQTWAARAAQLALPARAERKQLAA